MSFMLTRMFAYFTLVMYLVVGGMAVRFMAPEMTTVSLSSQYLNLFSKTSLKTTEAEALVTPELKFAEIKFPVAAKPKVIVAQKKVVVPVLPVVKVTPAKLEVVAVAKNELNFNEPVVLSKIELNNELPQNLVSLYQEFSYKETLVAQVEDAISTKQAVATSPNTEVEVEPTFFEYESEEEVVAAPKPVEEKIVQDIVEEKVAASETPVVAEEVAVDDLITFDYSKANEDIKAETMPVVSTVTTQNMAPEIAKTPILQEIKKTSNPAKKISTASTPVMSKANGLVPTDMQTKTKAFVPVTTHPSRVTIQAVATDLMKSTSEAGFEIRFQDDLSEAVQDYNSGSVNLDQELAEEKMTRSVTLLKRGFAPTNSDIIVEAGSVEVSLPLIEEQKFNELLAPFESRGPIGAVLVELDDEAEGATLDVPFSQVIQLDGDLKETDSNDYRYQLFVGVKAGNALLSYKGMKGDVTSKIIHIHEREVTFESNFFEDVANEKIVLVEEDLLSKEKAPLIITSEQVKQFATTKTSEKLNDHTYQMNFNKTLLGSRRYLELNHQQESVFVGVRDNNKVNVPSENFMRFMLSRFENSKLGNRCLVQVNLTKTAAKVDVAAESTVASVMVYTQMLDRDGKFYDSVGDKTEKIIVVGEAQGSSDYGQDAKINLKISYQDGSTQYLGSYCSPNTYLVEQL